MREGGRGGEGWLYPEEMVRWVRRGGREEKEPE